MPLDGYERSRGCLNKQKVEVRLRREQMSIGDGAAILNCDTLVIEPIGSDRTSPNGFGDGAVSCHPNANDRFTLGQMISLSLQSFGASNFDLAAGEMD